MKPKYALLALFFAVFFGWNTGAGAQPEMFSVRDAGVPVFYYEISNFAADSTGKSRLYISMKIPNDELQFLKTDNGYEAEYEFSVVVFNKKGEQIEGKSFRRKAGVKEYKDTNSNRIFQQMHTNLDLSPGEYKVILGLTDLDTKKTGRRKEKIRVRDFSKSGLELSDIIFVRRKNIRNTRISDLSPEVEASIADTTRQMFVYFEVYSPKVFPTYEVSYKILNFRRKKIAQEKLQFSKTGWRTKVFIPIDIASLDLARYKLVLDVKGGGKKRSVERFFHVRNLQVPLAVTNLDEAIEQLQYIASRKEMKKMRNAPKDKKREYFEAFWKAKDPTPGTATNELMDEYYRRVEFANQHFSGFREGWRTDMGMIYILFGPPNDVERQPFNVEASPFYETEIYAYEVWYYYDLNRRFIFADHQGFGDYRLENPMAIYNSYY